ncbi:MAG: SDR family oxidoreductase, partial [Myxococcales bacterium]|nr:SDR family oxidoreductase [Myxococcales bacterium]
MTETRRVMLVTGSTDGIGRQTALELAQAGHHVIVHGRSRPKVDAALAWLRERAAGAEVDGVSFDLGSLASVRKGARELLERAPAIHVLINNAGVFCNERGLTGDGIELTFAVNHVGPFLLTHLLGPALQRGAPARVINLSSIAHTRGQIALDDLNLERGWSGYAAYAQSKLANVMHALSLAERWASQTLAAYSLHPGVVDTKLLREGFGPVRGVTVEQGARTSVMLAGSARVDAPSGSYFVDGVPAPVASAALDDDVRAALWAATAR